MTLELTVCVRDVAAARGELDVLGGGDAGAFRTIEMIANRALGASSAFPERARYPGVWTATVPGYADG